MELCRIWRKKMVQKSRRPDHSRAKNEALARSLLVTSIYAFIGFAWIIGSEIVLSLMHNESSAVFLINISKGLGFVAATSLLICFLIYNNLKKIIQESRIRAVSETRLNDAQHFAHIGSFEYDSGSNKLTASKEALNIL